MPVGVLDRIAQRERDRQAWTMRVVENRPWAEIVLALGLNGESTARAMAQRYARANGLPPLTQPNPRRTAAARYAVAQRFGRQPQPVGPELITRTFGVEIEYIDKPRPIIAQAIADALGVAHIHTFGYHGDRCETCGVTIPKAEKYAQWKVERDGTVPTGGEVVSPILQGADGFAQIVKVTKAMRDAGAKVNKRCGLHVHMGVKDIDIFQRANLIENFYKAYPILKRLVAKGRWFNPYCKVPTAYTLAGYLQYMRTNRQEPAGNHTDALNIQNFTKIGTYEFRMHQGTLNAKKIEAWVKFILAFIENNDRLALGVVNLTELVDAVAGPIENKVNPLDARLIAFLKGRETALHREFRQPAVIN